LSAFCRRSRSGTDWFSSPWLLGGEVDGLASRRREPRIRELREPVALLSVEKYGQRVREVAGRLEKNPGSVSHWITTAAEWRSRDSGFARRLGKLDTILRGGGSPRDS
jgi:hypothetical protein